VWEGGVAAETLQDILTRFGRKVASAGDDNNRAGQGAKPHLLPDRHPVRDFFIADLLDWALKDDRASMEHPFFSLSKKPDRQVRRYERNGVHVTIKPGADGMATIWDKDVLIYAISQLVEALNRGQPINRTVQLKAYDLLVATNRHTGGENYDRLAAALGRLKATVIETDIATNGMRQRRGFGLIDSWEIVEKTGNGRMVAIQVTLSEWLYNAAVAKEVLTLNRDYFRLDGGLERRLYELARKHCGHQAQWTVGMELLHIKSGSTDLLKRFRAAVKRIVMADTLPDYRLKYDSAGDQVVFYTKDVKRLAESISKS
jgi:plasmid replication initiation protein